MIGQAQCTGNSTERYSAAAEVMELLGEVVGFSEHLACLVQDRLKSITLPEVPALATQEEVPDRMLPELFDAMRAQLRCILRNMRSIEETIDRVEV